MIKILTTSYLDQSQAINLNTIFEYSGIFISPIANIRSEFAVVGRQKEFIVSGRQKNFTVNGRQKEFAIKDTRT